MNWIYICKAQIQPQFIETASATRAGRTHTTVAKTLFNDSFCDCEGFEFRGYCKHTTLADENYCRWFTPITPENRDTIKGCPKCGGEIIAYTFDLEFDG